VGDGKLIHGAWDVWGSLFNGIVGSAIGATIAVVVLVVSLKKQSTALAAQLTAQQEALATQLAASESENSKNRINAAAGELMESISLIPAYRIDAGSFSPADQFRSFNVLYRLSLDLTGEEITQFFDPMLDWIKHLTLTPLSEFCTSGQDKPESPDCLFFETGWLLRKTSTWIRASADGKMRIGKEIKSSLDLARGNAERWLEVYPPSVDVE